MFLFIPLLFGCSTKVKPDGTEQPAHVCPRCNNASVFAAKSKTWFEFFFVPLVPLSSKHIWLCGICQWASPLGVGQWEPPIAYQTPQHHSFSGYNAGYQPSYAQPPNQK
ncbi:hypothetical protein D9757_001787 [Collybiopsis confluens]|uniref:Zinc-ribbon 15 domain-containing protein n=1 Tax=Collybiopsis confluens TaxID=2823264 RepID=A0A8H5HYI8_9AGAR|nr:hypothetical protein D9757_001787 [Collybiopsis confluens]